MTRGDAAKTEGTALHGQMMATEICHSHKPGEGLLGEPLLPRGEVYAPEHAVADPGMGEEGCTTPHFSSTISTHS